MPNLYSIIHAGSWSECIVCHSKCPSTWPQAPSPTTAAQARCLPWKLKLHHKHDFQTISNRNQNAEWFLWLQYFFFKDLFIDWYYKDKLKTRWLDLTLFSFKWNNKKIKSLICLRRLPTLFKIYFSWLIPIQQTWPHFLQGLSCINLRI